MKIGIITLHYNLNYGAVLQAFALQKKLNEMGYDAELINFVNPMAKNNTSFTFPETVKEIKENVFGNNPYLKKVELNSSIKIIPNYAFSNCSNLTEITIPNSVEEIGFNAFFGCKNLKEVHIPKSVEKMGIMAFYSNHEELVIHCEHDKEPSGWIGWQDADEVIWGYTG